MRDWTIYVKDILAAIESIESFVSGMDQDSYQRDDKTASAVIRKFEIMGEAVRQIPTNVRTAYPEVAWNEMAGMRNRLIHSYADVNYQLIWQTIKNDSPIARAGILRILKENPQSIQ